MVILRYRLIPVPVPLEIVLEWTIKGISTASVTANNLLCFLEFFQFFSIRTDAVFLYLCPRIWQCSYVGTIPVNKITHLPNC